MTNKSNQSAPPDGGWGWVVLTAAFTNALLMQGLIRSSGILYKNFGGIMEITDTQAAVVSTIGEAIMRFMGPMTGFFAQNYGYKRVAFLGGILGGVGVAISSISQNFIHLLITFGIMFGIGTGLTLLTGDIITGLYFDKKLALALGIEFSGGALGAFIAAPVLQKLIEYLGLRGAVLIYGGILFHTCATSLLYREGAWFKRRATILLSRPSLHKTESTATIIDNMEEANEDEIPTAPRKLSIFSTDNITTRRNSVCGVLPSEVSVELGLNNADISRPRRRNSMSIRKISESSQSERSSHFDPSSIMETQIEQENVSSGTCLGCEGRVDLSMFQDPYFWIVNCTNICAVMGFPMFLTILPVYSQKEVNNAITEQEAAFLLSAFNLADLVGRVSFGWLSDRQLLPRKYGFMLTLFVSAALLSAFPFLSSYYEILGCSIAYGIIIGAANVNPAVILNDAVGPIRFPLAYGFVVTFSSLGSFAAGPILGLVYGSTGSYKGCFFILAAVLTFGGFVWLTELVYCLYQRTKRTHTKDEEMEAEKTRF